MAPEASNLKRAAGPRASVSPPPTKRRLQSTVTQKSVATFFTPASQKKATTDEPSWQIVDRSLLVGKYQPQQQEQEQKEPLGTNESHEPGDAAPRKIAAFDFDSTLISSASGNRFPKDSTDWKWWHSSIPNALRELHRDGYHVIIFTNQGGINLYPDSKTVKSDGKRHKDFKIKTASVLKQLDLPITIYAATSKDQYRKPRVGMWKKFLDDFNLDSSSAVDRERSIFVGDAGGRPGGATAGAVKDHSCSDRNFAANIGIPFSTPEEYFLSEEPRPFLREFDPAEFLRAAPSSSNATFSKANPVDIVLFCGSPGAGKSTFYWNQLEPLGYQRVNQDMLKTRDKCLKVASELLAEGKSVAVDNTNADPDTRAYWVNLAKRLEVPIRCLLFTATPLLCEHNNIFRALTNDNVMNPEKRTMLPKLAFTGFSSRYRRPKVEEGFQDIVTVDFQFEGTDEQREAWSKYWL